MRTQQDIIALSAFRRSRQAPQLRDFLERSLALQRDEYIANADAGTAEMLRAHARDTAAAITALFTEVL
jgi:hypothetical protein